MVLQMLPCFLGSWEPGDAQAIAFAELLDDHAHLGLIVHQNDLYGAPAPFGTTGGTTVEAVGPAATASCGLRFRSLEKTPLRGVVLA